MMNLDPVTNDMDIYQVADALLLAPFSHPDTWQKRTHELRRQGRGDEADLVETMFAERFTDKARRDHDRTARMIERTFGP